MSLIKKERKTRSFFYYNSQDLLCLQYFLKKQTINISFVMFIYKYIIIYLFSEWSWFIEWMLWDKKGQRNGKGIFILLRASFCYYDHLVLFTWRYLKSNKFSVTSTCIVGVWMIEWFFFLMSWLNKTSALK